MAESPVVREARERLISLVPSAVETIGELLDSQADGVRLGAAREVMDRGGLPARSEHHVDVEIGIDAEIEQLLRGVARQRVAATDTDDLNIEDAIVLEDEEETEVPIGEQVALPGLVAPFGRVGTADQAQAVQDDLEDLDTAPAPISQAWWQANPTEPPL